MKYADFDVPELPLTDFKYAHMDFLLDGDVYPQIMLSGFRKNFKIPLIAQQTIFGWVVTGKMPQSDSFPFRSEFHTDFSIRPSRREAFAQNVRSDCYRAISFLLCIHWIPNCRHCQTPAPLKVWVYVVMRALIHLLKPAPTPSFCIVRKCSVLSQIAKAI